MASLHQILIIHGDGDEVVPVENARGIYEMAGQPKELVIIPGGDHTLSDPGHRERALGICLNWFLKYL